MGTRISKKGSIVIPAHLRKQYQLEPGTEVKIIDYAGILAIVPVSQDPLSQSAGMLSDASRPLTKALLRDRITGRED